MKTKKLDLASLMAGDGSTRGKVLDKQKIIPDTLPKKRPTEAQLRRALGGLLDMLTEWDGGFDGFHAVNQAERLLGRPKSEQPAPSGLSGRERKSKR